jgi:hypothetical protein
VREKYCWLVADKPSEQAASSRWTVAVRRLEGRLVSAVAKLNDALSFLVF